ncbi:hypothetical protein [Streptomyces sp. CNQ085]|uniref:hypothetical protein n=1 Tax=Streptomyces sp. CNQ085 TaxID=2886944 RepID=UPI001F508E02|nr:hypothetical protein [Streptomyces sp. CNQ085]MCI0386509.1 hypothetical protein [Streptomyces sp. CNQ085]
MTCDRLVCANCAGPVSEGRCPLCRAHHERLHRENGPFSLGAFSPAALAALLLALIAVALLARQAAV